MSIYGTFYENGENLYEILPYRHNLYRRIDTYILLGEIRIACYKYIPCEENET